MDIFDSTIVKLDEEFKAGLHSIRGYLMNLTSPQAARCCGEWLQKLSNSSEEREVRNLLLKRLTSQVQTRSLHYPFDRLPPDRPLYTIYEEEGDGDATSSGWSSTSYDSNRTTSNPEPRCQTSPPAAAQEGGAREEDDGCGVPDRCGRARCRTEKVQPRPSTSEGEHRPHQVVERKELRSRGEQTDAACRTVTTTATVAAQTLPSSVPSLECRETEVVREAEEYKKLLWEYKRVMKQDLADLAERVETTVRAGSQLHTSHLDHLRLTLHDAWTANLQRVEEELVREVGKVESELRADRSSYESRIQQLTTVIQDKDQQINSLDWKIKEQAESLKEKMKWVKTEISAAAKHNQTQYKKKYSMLRRQLAEVESVNKELMRHYEQNIVLTVKDYETKVNSAKLLAASESMTEMEDKIKQLEQIYQRIFHEYKKKMEEERKSRDGGGGRPS